ncbi:MAG TPA: FecR family protein [Kofleriaceae bacterium]|nr:FecR family protein [Kofleriaceae bacterium]
MSLDQLGDAIARSQDAAIAASVDAARRRLATPPPRRRRIWLPALAAIATLVALVLGVRSYLEPEPITFQVGERPGTPGEPIEAPPAAELQLRFSDSTTVLLAAATRGVVDDVTPRGARVHVERGRAAVSVPPGRNAEWTFDVGPFEIAVTGTRFDVSWDDQAQVFLLVMHDGSVKVRGPTIEDRRVVVAGETLRVPLGPITASAPPRDTGPAADARAIAAATGAPAEVAPPPPPPRAPAPPRAPPDAPPPPSWQDLAAGGDFHAALTAARAGFDATCATASAGDVTALGDVARYAGDLAHAQQAYLAVRRRFPGPDAAAATFALARMAFQAPDDAQAIHWLDTYLREDPDGALAREALGRLLEVYARIHDDAAARRTAQRYLDAYPSGPHAKLARSILP